ncbi:unnamed protein product [Linum trigynum]|uniref:Uncharacterized protein n=1 Tax=Linum trigynum TaxID=586398 RepID=A0AAV2CCM0_9ROSI
MASTSDPRTPDTRVRILSTETIHANNTQTLLERIPLTACDICLILVSTIQKGLLFRSPTDDHPISRQAFIENLKSAFSKTTHSPADSPPTNTLTAPPPPTSTATTPGARSFTPSPRPCGSLSPSLPLPSPEEVPRIHKAAEARRTKRFRYT